MSDDYTKDYVEDMAKSPGGKPPGEIAQELKKQLLVKEYIDEATEGMGGKQKNDVARELRSHILDSADALAAERKVPVDENLIVEVLSKMGPAKKIAAMYPAKKAMLEHGMGKALLSLAGIAAAFLVVAGILWVVSPDTLNATLAGSGESILQVVLSVAFALAIATVVVAAIFMCMYVYDTRLKAPYEARLKAFERSLNDHSSPINVAIKIACTAVWLVLLNLFWARVPFIQSFGDGATLIPLLADRFAPFVLYLNAIGIASMIVAGSYLVLRQKWISSGLDALLDLCNALVFLWMLAAFPFNPALATGPALLIRFILAFVVFGCLVSTAKNLWDTMKFALYGRIGKNDTV